MRVRQVHSSKPFEYCLPAGAEIMFELLSIIHRSDLLLMIFLSKLEWKQHINCPDYDLKASRSDVM